MSFDKVKSCVRTELLTLVASLKVLEALKGHATFTAFVYRWCFRLALLQGFKRT